MLFKQGRHITIIIQLLVWQEEGTGWRGWVWTMHTLQSGVAEFYPDGWVTKCFITSRGQEAPVTAGSGPGAGGRGIHVIQENSKENVIMCQLQPADDRDEQNTILHAYNTTNPNKYNCCVARRLMKRNDCKNINHEKPPRWRGSGGSTELVSARAGRCCGARPCIRSASVWAARTERGLRCSNAHHQAICHLINNNHTEINKVKPSPTKRRTNVQNTTT